MVPTIKFLEPEGRRFLNVVWWHAPIVISEPKSWLSAQFTRKEIVNCEASIALLHKESHMKLCWKSNGPKGNRRQTLRYHQEYALPIAIRSAGTQPIY